MTTRSPHTVNDVMTTTVVAVGPDARFREVVSAMRQWQASAVPVLDGDGRVTGVVSEADLLPKEELRARGSAFADPAELRGEGAKAGGLTARDVMTSPAVTVTASATLPQAARLMARHRVKRLPVVDGSGVLKGIVSRGDLLKVFLRADAELSDEIREEVVDRLFPVTRRSVTVEVDQGTVTLSGAVADPALVPVAERLARSVEGVVDVRCLLTAPVTAPAGAGGREAGRPG
ncbi:MULTISPECIES: CBS domain-containing protein [unclassified Streptomyces]|uniref:CBS domain-containing protein n=1 Tax=unclassified Streptomyces TaxID=2593676 RepID=UPI0033E59AFA